VSDTTRHPDTGPAPTAEVPELGVIAIAVGGSVVPISQVEHWVEDGLHVFRSTEFDCMATDEDLCKTVEAFIETAEDLYRFYDDLVDAERATPDEVRTLAVLSRRFYDVYSAQAKALRGHKRRVLMRPRDFHDLTWQRQTTHHSSSPPVPA
jgi:hypothetical protein